MAKTQFVLITDWHFDAPIEQVGLGVDRGCRRLAGLVARGA